MSEPTKEEINRSIAEYMGWKYHTTHSPAPVCTHEKYADRCLSTFKYTDSLDALVPVWEKLDMYKVCVIVNYIKYFCKGQNNEETIQHAAALATYKAIKEMGE